MDGQAVAQHDGRSGKDGQAPSPTCTRCVLGVGNHSGKEILRAHFKFFCGKGKARHRESHRPRSKPVTSPLRLTKTGRGDVLKLHLKRATQGEAWSHVEPKDSGPDVGRLYQTPKEANKPQESEPVAQPDHSLLTSELLALGKELIGELDYEDVEEADPGLADPEIVQAVAHIPQADTWANVEMQESHSPPSFETEISRSRYDVNLVRTNPTEPGSASPVTLREDKMLDEGANSRTPGAGRLGTDENPGCTEDN